MGGSGVAAPPSCDIGARWCGPAVHRRHRTADGAANEVVTTTGAASVFILRRIGGRSPYAARRRDPPTGGERYSRRVVRRGAYCSVERVVRYTGPTGGKDESTGWEGQEKAHLRSDRTFPTRNCPPDETGWVSASRKMCCCCCWNHYMYYCTTRLFLVDVRYLDSP